MISRFCKLGSRSHRGMLLLHPRGSRSGSGYSVPMRHPLFGPICPTRGHTAWCDMSLPNRSRGRENCSFEAVRECPNQAHRDML
jgi:hypothetical protein